MGKCCVLLAVLVFLLLAQILVANPFLEQEDNADDYNDNLDRLLQSRENEIYKRTRLRRCTTKSKACFKVRRSCIKRGATCDHRPNDCCYSSSCRCNFWGTNCRCERQGLFQQWGK